MDHKELLSDLLAALSLSKKKFAEGLGLSQGNVSDWFNKPNARPSIGALKRISETYNVNLNWLVTGEGAMFIDTRARRVIPAGDLLRLPVVADIAAGTGIEAFDVEPDEWLTLHPSLLAVPGPYLAFKVSGESMAPYILNNDYAVVTQAWHDLDINERICAVRTIDGLTLKRFLIDKRKRYMLLMPLNPLYPVMKYDDVSPDYTIIGLLVVVVRKFA